MSDLRFKYKELTSSGDPVAGFSRKGEITDDEIVLDERRIPLDAIARAVSRYDRLMLLLAPEDDQTTLVIAITSGAAWGNQTGRARELRRALNHHCSRI